MPEQPRYIIHVDMDAFFAAVEQRDNPAYRGKPLVVGDDPKKGKGRGVVSTCSYEARKFGIHSAMPIAAAYRACPDAVFLGVDMDRYERASAQVYRILDAFSPDIEPAGIDEAFLDITHTHRLFGSPRATCLTIKKRIRDETALTASVGLAPTMMAAKIASDLEKPDGMVEVTPAGLLDFLRPLGIRKLWGLGPKSEEALHRAGIRTIGELARRAPKELEALFGAQGIRFWRLANGIDEREVTAGGEARSIGNETTFDADTADPVEIERELARLCEKVSGRLRAATVKARTVTLKIRLEGFETYTRSRTLTRATNYFDCLYNEIKGLYNTFGRRNRRVRLVGVKASNLAPAACRDSLFDDHYDGKNEKTHAAVDRINERFGDGAIFRAGSAAVRP